jgi:hypothetical protein
MVLNSLKKNNENSIVELYGLKILAKPQHIFTFHKDGIQQIAGIWFTAQKDGYRTEELGMFCELLFRYLEDTKADDSEINPDFGIALDVFNNIEIRYSQMQGSRFEGLLNSTVEEMNRIV